MKCAIVFLVVGISLVAGLIAPPAGAPPPATNALAPAVATLPPPPTLTQDLEELALFVPQLPLRQLTLRYLLNDPQFQSFVRILNSYDVFSLRLRLYSQPEVFAFFNWVRTQLLLSGGGGSLELEESEELLTLFNHSPYWSQSVAGWQGFWTEFELHYPVAYLRAHIDAKVLLNGSFAQFWQRLTGLRPVYERLLATPEAQRVIANLNAAGIDTTQIDQYIRTLFDWVIVAPSTTTEAPTAVPLALA